MYKRYFERKDYEMLCDWWRGWKWDAVPLEFLPPMGIVVGDDEGDICAVFLYRTDTPIVWAENYISNPKARGKRRKGAMTKLLEEIDVEVKNLGYSVIMSAVKHDNLAEKLRIAGFIESDGGLTNFIKGVV